MSYQKIYRGEFANTLPDVDNAPNPQVVRIDISDTTSGSAEETSVVAKYTSSLFHLIIDSDGHNTYEELAAFFFNGQRLRINGGGANDGEWIVSGFTLTPPTMFTTGKVEININNPSAPGSESITNVTFTNIPAEPVVVPLDMAGDPLKISVIDDDEDKFTTIRAKQAVIKILTSLTIDINTFCDGTDRQFYVEIFVDELINFRGYLVIPDMQMDFQPLPNELTLTASDNLGALKDITLVDDNSVNPTLDNKLIDYLRWSLLQTGIEQNINVVNSLKHGSGSFSAEASFVASQKEIVLSVSLANKFYIGMSLTISGSSSNDGTYTIRAVVIENILGFDFAIVFVNESVIDESNVNITIIDNSSSLPFHRVVNLDAKTFEKEIGISEDCYSVINKILGEDSVCFQFAGEWWILRIDEIEEIEGIFQYNVTTYNINDGTVINETTAIKEKNIGKPDTMAFMNDNAVLIPDRAVKRVKLTYNYEFPLESVCNIDFSRGNFIETLPDISENNATYNVSKFNLDNWDFGTFTRLNKTPGATTAEHYIQRLYQNGYEKQRYAVGGFATEADPTVHLRSCPIRINKKDKFTVSVDIKWSVDTVGDDVASIGGLLYGTDGSVWEMGVGLWINRTAITPGGPIDIGSINALLIHYTSADQKLQWTSASIEAIEAPVDGYMYFYLLTGYNQGGTGNPDKYFQNFRFDYAPFVNGSFQVYKGQYNQVTQESDYVTIRDKIIYMGEPAMFLAKGAMKFYNGNDYLLTYAFTDAHWTAPTPYGKIQAFEVWNQYKYNARNFDEDVDLLESDSVDGGEYNGVDLIHKINLTDVNVNTVKFFFLILHYEQDFYLLEMSGYIASLYRKDLGKSYTDSFEFKYITQ